MDRLKILKIIITIVAVATLARLFYWQFLANLPGAQKNVSQQEIPAPHGEIFSSDGFPLVTNQEAFLLYAKPHDLDVPPKTVAEKLAPYLIPEKFATVSASVDLSLREEKEKLKKEKASELEKSLSDPSLFWVQLARKVSSQAKEKIEAEKIKALGFEKDDKRFYPEASMAAQLLGFVASDKFGRDTGYFGLEGYYNRRLRGKPGKPKQIIDAFGFPILIDKYLAANPKKGASLYLSIDRTIQFIVENNLKRAVEKYGAKSGTVVVANPKNGNILAMATYPTYNPQNFQAYEQDLYKNPAVAETYEPGSTFKVIAMAAALDTNSVTPDTICTVCDGPRQIGGFEISTWNKKYFPNSTLTDVIVHSDNVGMTFVADKLGLDRFHEYIAKFGFGQPTNIDLQEESSGVLHPKNEWRPIDLATASFGQGLGVTPIQIVQAVGAIANRGILNPPKIVQKIVDNGREETVKKDASKRVISEKTALQITEMMVNAVDLGESRYFKPKGYRVAGKTGTAQIPVAGHYDPNKTIASFVGFAPADEPKFVMLVKFTEPSSSQFGSETAAPTFFDIAKELFIYLGIPSD